MYCIYICILMSQFEGASWLWSYGNWNYNYLYSRLSITTKVVQIPFMARSTRKQHCIGTKI